MSPRWNFVEEFRATLQRIEKGQQTIMDSMTSLQAAVAAEDTVIASALTLINGFAAQLANLQPNQAAITALQTDVTAQAASLSAAVAANTPGGPVVPAAPVATPPTPPAV